MSGHRTSKSPDASGSGAAAGSDTGAAAAVAAPNTTPMPEAARTEVQQPAIPFDANVVVHQLEAGGMDSSNGTHVNRKRVLPEKKQELKANDIIQIGEVQLKVQM